MTGTSKEDSSADDLPLESGVTDSNVLNLGRDSEDIRFEQEINKRLFISNIQRSIASLLGITAENAHQDPKIPRHCASAMHQITGRIATSNAQERLYAFHFPASPSSLVLTMYARLLESASHAWVSS